MFLRKIKDFSEQQKENHEHMSLIERMQMDRDEEEKSEELAKKDFKKKLHKIMKEDAFKYMKEDVKKKQQTVDI